MAVPNPLPVVLKGDRTRLIDEQLVYQIGTDYDHQLLVPEVYPELEPVGLLTDANCIFVDGVGGADINVGDRANPVLTMEHAIDLAVAGYPVIMYICAINNDCRFVEDDSLRVNGCIAIPKYLTFYYEAGITVSFASLGRQYFIPALTDLNTKFVDPTGGNNANPGTFAQPYETIQYAIDNIALAFDYIAIYDTGADPTYFEIDESINIVFTNTSNTLSIFPIYNDNGVYKAGATCLLRFNSPNYDLGATNRLYKNILPISIAEGGVVDGYLVSGKNGATTKAIINTIDQAQTNTERYTPGGATPTEAYGFAFFDNGTHQYWCGTNLGVFKSATGAAWVQTTGRTTGTFEYMVAYNSSILCAGSTGIFRTVIDGGAWTQVGTDTSISAQPVVIGDYLYYAIAGYIKRVDSQWNVETWMELGTKQYINGMVADTDETKLYCIERDSVNLDLCYYTISTSVRTVIYATTWGGAYPLVLKYYGGRVYMWDDSSNYICAFEDDGTKYEVIPSANTVWDFAQSDLGIVGLYSKFNVDTMLQYFAGLDVVNRYWDSGLTIMAGFIFDGNNRTARNGNTNGKYTYNSTFQNIFYSGLTIDNVGANNYTFFDIYRNLNIGIYCTDDTKLNCAECLFYNCDIAIDIEQNTSEIAINTFDFCRIVLNYRDSANPITTFGYNIFSRCSQLVQSSILAGTISYSLIDTPYYAGNVEIDWDTCKTGNPFFRDRDGVGGHIDYRLQAIDVLASNEQPYKFNSAGVGLTNNSIAGKGYTVLTQLDAGCYICTRNLYSDSYGYEWESDLLLVYANTSRLLTVSKFVNQAGLILPNIKGEYRAINLHWRPRNAQDWRDELETLYNIIMLPSPARLYINYWLDYAPAELLSLCQANNLGIESGPTAGNNAIFSVPDLTLTQDYILWKPNRYNGFMVYMQFTDPVAIIDYVMYFKILYNTADTLYLYNIEPEDVSVLPVAIDNTTNDLLFVIGAMDVYCHEKELKQQLAHIMATALPDTGSLDIQFKEGTRRQ